MSTDGPGEKQRDRYERLVRRFYDEAYSRGEYDVLGAMFASEYGGVGMTPGDHDPAGAEAARIGVERLRTPLPDISFNVRRVVVDGATAIAHLDVEGTHEGQWILGPDDDPFVAEPTGLTVEFSGMRSFRFDDGRVVECHGYGQWLDVMVHLGFATDYAEYAQARLA